jgi:hypothetical protein
MSPRFMPMPALVAGLLLALAMPSFAADEVDITGTYKVDGTTKDQCFITKKGDVYQLEWKYSTGVWMGVGIRDGDILSVGWDRPQGGNLGVSVFKIEKGDKGPKLTSKWAAYQDNKLSTEVLLFEKK